MSNDAEHEALLEARDFVEDEVEMRAALPDSAMHREAVRVLAVLDAALNNEDAA